MGLSLIEMWNILAKERFLFLRIMSSRENSFHGISLAQFQLALIFFFSPFCPLLCHDGNTAVGLGWKLLCSSSVPGEMLPRRWKDLCTTSVVQSISTWVQHSALTVAFVKNLTPEHLRLILSQPEPVASEGDCPAPSAGNLLLWAYMFLHVSEARVFLDTL